MAATWQMFAEFTQLSHLSCELVDQSVEASTTKVVTIRRASHLTSEACEWPKKITIIF